MREEIRRHVILFALYFGVVTASRVWSAVGAGTTFLNLVFLILALWLGGAIGYSLVFLDRLLYVYLIAPHEQLSQQVQYVVKKREFKRILELIYERRGEQKRLVFRSFIFAAAWVPLSLFALTSTGRVYAGTLVMGLGLHLLYDFWRDEQVSPQSLREKLFWQVKREVPFRFQRMFLYGYSAAFVLLSFLLV